MKRLLKTLLNIKQTTIESMEMSGGPDPWDTRLTINVKPTKGQQNRCPHCGRKCGHYDEGQGTRTWRAMDLGIIRVYLKSRAPRVCCPDHGVVVARVPWASHGSWFTHDFERWVTWMVLHTTRSVTARLCRIDWKTVGPVVGRIHKDISSKMPSLFDDLKSIGIDETSYKKGHKYLTVVVNHDTGAVIWIHEGYGRSVLAKFFEALTPEQTSSIETITGDGARWITECAGHYCPKATRLLDPFHIVQWATDALDKVRRRVWNELRGTEVKTLRGRRRQKAGRDKKASASASVKGLRYTLLKNPENLTDGQSAKLGMLASTNDEIFRAYGLKEMLRLTFRLKGDDAARSLEGWLSWAQRCRIPEFVELSKKIRRHKDRILQTIDSGLSNARVEAINNKIKLTQKMGYGFRNIDSLIALIMLRCSNLPLELPGRGPAVLAAQGA
jgi:transposase